MNNDSAARKFAFVDESSRSGSHLMCAATVASASVSQARQVLRALRLPGQRRIHFSSENDRRRKTILTEIASIETLTYVYVVHGVDAKTARSMLLEALVEDMVALSVTDLVLESREGQDPADREILARRLRSLDARIKYDHETPFSEPLLWIPDAVVWADGRSKAWRRILDRLDLVAERRRIDL